MIPPATSLSRSIISKSASTEPCRPRSSSARSAARCARACAAATQARRRGGSCSAGSIAHSLGQTIASLPDMNLLSRPTRLIPVGGDRVRDVEGERRQRFDELFAAHSADVVAYCSWRAASASDAQDAAAEVFLIAWRRLDDVPEGDAARVWLYATARRVVANQRRSTRRRLALQERLARETPVTASRPDGGEEALVHDALLRLGRQDREVLLLAEWEGLTPAQIAAVMGCLTVTARGRLHRARRRFRAVFEDVAARGEPRREAASVHPVQSVSGGGA